MFDTHAHLEMLEDNTATVLRRAQDAGVMRILSIGSTAEANSAVVKASSTHAGVIFGAIGFDRDQARLDQTEHELDSMMGALRESATANTGKVVALGETGLDFHYHKETASAQIDLLAAQLTLARELRLPVIIHSREAEAETRSCLAQHTSLWKGDPKRVGVIHCFTGSRDLAEQAIEMGYMISFSGILTFRNAQEIRDTAKSLPADMILVETDAPFLAPEPLRGKKNEPAFLKHTLECLAAVRGTSFDEMARTTEQNACRLFAVS